MSIIKGLADAVALDLKTFNFERDLTVESVLYVDLDRSNLDGLSIYVLPGEVDIEGYSRNQNTWDISITVVVTFSSSDEEEIDDTAPEMLTLVEALMQSFVKKSLQVDAQRYTVESVKLPVPYNSERLKDEMLFESIFSLGFSTNQ